MNDKYKTGLNDSEVALSRNKYGSNVLTKKKKITFFKLVIESLSDPIIKVLVIALAIKVIFLFKDSNIYESIGIALSIFISSFISALSEYGSEKAFEKLNEENSKIKYSAIRNSKLIKLYLDEIVVGDIILLNSGEKIPADGRIVDGIIYVDESMLSGESKEKKKDIIDPNINMGSIISTGKCKIEVTQVGDKTLLGKISSMVQERTIESPLKFRLRKLASTISKLSYISAIIVFISYILNIIIFSNESINFNTVLYGLTLSVAIIVMSVPEGLPMLVTLVLSSNMKKMLKNNVLVRKLVGIETAGSLNILFADKTGTLTEGKFKVEGFVDLNNNLFDSMEKIPVDIKEDIYNSLVYNNEAFINNNVIDGGNNTDKSILEFVGSNDKSKYKIIDNVNFDSNKKYSLVKLNNNKIYIKGAYEVVAKKCKYYYLNKTKYLLNKNFDNIIDCYTKSGYRIITLALAEGGNDYCLFGFLILRDKIRNSSCEGVKKIKSSGVNVVMVTGDSKETAISVSNSVGILENNDDIVLSSEEFNNMSNDEIKNIISRLKVLCRCLPQDKNRLVKICQEMDLIVGMTGDGINDAPALKKADVGFAVGSATEVAKETSDIVILDNNIMSISTAILYGRTIFKSIRKFVIFQLTINLSAVLINIIAPFMGIAEPLTVIQVLWINMIMDALAGIAFACEPALNEYMNEKPKKRNEPILNRYMINQILCDGIYSFILCIWFLTSNLIKEIYIISGLDRYLYTAFFGLFIFLAIFNSFNARTTNINIFRNILDNKVFLFIISFIIIIQVLMLYYGGNTFRTIGLTLYEFEIMLILAFTIIPFDIIRKIIIKKLRISKEI